jgi:hypothetical protein
MGVRDGLERNIRKLLSVGRIEVPFGVWVFVVFFFWVKWSYGLV